MNLYEHLIEEKKLLKQVKNIENLLLQKLNCEAKIEFKVLCDQ